MSSRFPVLTGSELVKALGKLGFVEKRQKGSHLTMYHEADKRRVTIPIHKGVDLPGGTLRAILKDADVSPERLREVL